MNIDKITVNNVYDEYTEDSNDIGANFIFWLNNRRIGHFMFSTEAIGDFQKHNNLSRKEKRKIITDFRNTICTGGYGNIMFKQINGVVKIEKIGYIIEFYISSEMYECSFCINSDLHGVMLLDCFDIILGMF